MWVNHEVESQGSLRISIEISIWWRKYKSKVNGWDQDSLLIVSMVAMAVPIVSKTMAYLGFKNYLQTESIKT